MKTITIDWSYPIEIDNILLDDRMNDIGIYYITRDFAGKKSDLYIGKTIHSFGSRIESHWWNWLDNYRGTKYVRLGTVVKPSNISEDRLKQLINDVEMTIIFCMRNNLIHNTACKSSCNPSERLTIINKGYRGNLPEEIYIPDDEWYG